MVYTSHKTNTSAGFTLIEMLIVAPIVVLVIGGFIGLMVALTGNVLGGSSRNKLIDETESSLSSIKQDTRLAVQFPQTGLTPASPQGYNSSTTPWSTTTHHAIIMRQVATTKNPLDPSRDIVYKKDTSGNCSTDPYLFDVVYYFTQPVANGPYHLWRRVVFDSASSPCTGVTPWQRSSCAPGHATVAICQTDDEEVSTHISGARWFYPAMPDTSTASVSDLVSHISNINGGTTSTGEAWINTSSIFNPSSDAGVNASSLILLLSTTDSPGGKQVSYTGITYATRFAALSDSGGVATPPNTAPPGSQTFAYTGNSQSWTVPAGVYTLTAEVWGAQGGTVYAAGGLGGYAKGTFTVTPGQTLYIYVGGTGSYGTSLSGAGFNGGGNGNYYGGGGGGATDVRRGGTALSNRVIVGGGGGGGGYYANPGGIGGGTTGGTGGNATNGTAAYGGGGGTQTAGGTGSGTYPGVTGSLGIGGNAGSNTGPYAYAGGGGGGYYGGGGGAASVSSAGDGYGASGGGGSSYVGGVTGGTTTGGMQSGNGTAKFSW